MRHFISLQIIILVFSTAATAQTGPVEYFKLEMTGFCGMKKCEADNSVFHPQTPDLWEMDAGFLTDRRPDDAFALSLNKFPLKLTDAKLQPDENIIPITGDQDFAVIEPLFEGRSIPGHYDLLRNEDKGLGTKLLRAAVIVHPAQVLNLLMMIQFPDHFNYSINSWAEAKSNLKRAWTSPPVWDKDPWTTNIIGHPYIGSFYYNMLRSQGASSRTSFLYATGQSLLWEFVIEAVAEQPSIQDLLFTSTIGSAAGELAHRATLRLNRNGFSTFEKILVTIINPSYVINNGYRKRHAPPSPGF